MVSVPALSSLIQNGPSQMSMAQRKLPLSQQMQQPPQQQNSVLQAQLTSSQLAGSQLTSPPMVSSQLTSPPTNRVLNSGQSIMNTSQSSSMQQLMTQTTAQPPMNSQS